MAVHSKPTALPGLPTEADINKGVGVAGAGSFERSGLASRLLFEWVYPTLRRAAERPLGLDEHLELPTGCDADSLFDAFWELYNQPGASVGWVVWRMQRRKVLCAVGIAFLGVLSKFGSTLAVRAISEQLITGNTGSWESLIYAVVLWLMSLVDALTLAHANLLVGRSAIGAYATFATVAKYKARTLHPFVRPNYPRGALVSLALSDLARTVDMSGILVAGLMAPVQMVGSVALAMVLIGPEVLIMAVWIVALMLAIQQMGAFQARCFLGKMMVQGERLSITNEMLQAIRMVKLGAWEEYFEEIITNIRAREEQKLVKMRLSYALTHPLSCTMMPVAGLSIFLLHILIRGGMPSLPNTFALIQILRTLSVPFSLMGFFSGAVNSLLAAVKRLGSLMASLDLDRESVVSSAAPAGLSAVMDHSSFAWTKDRPTLRDICIRANKGQLIFVVGHLGQGKSSLLQALLGEMEKGGVEPGSVCEAGSAGKRSCSVDGARGISYLPQQSFVINATVQDNIVFGSALDSERYRMAVHSAGLDLDLETLPGGDYTEIGEKGVTLSGGQKARVGLARVAYSPGRLALLDDPFAALDMEVGRHVFEHLLCGALADVTRIVTSSQVHMLEDHRVDNILVVSDGQVVEQGTFAELSVPGTALHELLQFSTTSSGANSKRKEEEEPGREGGKTPSARMRRPYVSSSVSRVTVDEQKRVGAVSLSTLRFYLGCVGSPACIAALLVMIWLLTVGEYGPDLWLSVWQDDVLGETVQFYMAIWALIALGGVGLMACSVVSCAMVTARAATRLHRDSLRSLLLCPMSFFEQTPSGRLLNRFGEDQTILDMMLGRAIESSTTVICKTINTLAVVLVSAPWVAVVVACSMPIYKHIWTLQRCSFREAQRSIMLTKSPMFSTFEESLAGCSTIQAFGMERFFERKFRDSLNTNLSWLWTRLSATIWTELHLMLLVSFIVFAYAVCVLLSGDQVDPGIATLGLIYVVILAEVLRFLANLSSQAESNLTAVERSAEIMGETHEASRSLPGDSAAATPKLGATVEFKQVVLRYRPHLEPALKSISFSVQAGERVGIVGRSGSGKSTLLLALLRLVEPCSGKIFIGPLDASSLGLRLLRQLVTIIPQDPVMFSGTVRWNLDPTERHTDGDVQKACVKCGIIEMRPTFTLEEKVNEGGSNFSVGERQLMCMARAILRRGPVMLFDEATANIDVENDARLQRVLRDDFAGATVLTVAHRLGTIIDYDRVLALSLGEVVEFDLPAALLARGQGVFAGLAREAGLLPASPAVDELLAPADIEVKLSEAIPQQATGQLTVGSGRHVLWARPQILLQQFALTTCG